MSKASCVVRVPETDGVQETEREVKAAIAGLKNSGRGSCKFGKNLNDTEMSLVWVAAGGRKIPLQFTFSTTRLAGTLEISVGTVPVTPNKANFLQI